MYQGSPPIEAVNDFTESLNQGGQCNVLTLNVSKVLDKSHMLTYTIDYVMDQLTRYAEIATTCTYIMR